MGQATLTPADVFLRPPASASSHVLKFCARISPHAPVRVAARPYPGMRAGMCFHNVRDLVAKHGGTAVTGWLIWEWEDTYIEAEHHALWRQNDRMVEVTPRHPHHEHVLFLPDPDRAFDFAGRRRHDNIRQALRSDANVREYITLAARGVAIEELATVSGLAPEQARTLDDIWLRMRCLESELGAWSLRRQGRNAPCWCGSGRKVKRCTHPPAPARALESA